MERSGRVEVTEGGREGRSHVEEIGENGERENEQEER